MIRMAIQVVLIDEAKDREDVHEIVRIDRGELCLEGLGLSLAEGKAISGGIQQVLAGAQVAEWQKAQRICDDCGRCRSLKGRHPIVFRTPFGALRLDSERGSILPMRPEADGFGEPLGGPAARTRQPGTALSGDQVCLADVLRPDGPIDG